MKKIVYILLVVVIGSVTFSCKNDSKEVSIEPVITAAELEAIEQQKVQEEAAKKVRIDQANSVMSKLMMTPETKKFTSAVITVSLSDLLLKEAGPFTVFAPSTAAFDKMASESKAIMTDVTMRSFLERTIRTHIVAGQIDSISLTKNIRSGNGKYNIVTMSGDTLVASKKGMNIVLKDKNGAKATLVKSDILGTNGVVHVLDNVLGLEK